MADLLRQGARIAPSDGILSVPRESRAQQFVLLRVAATEGRLLFVRLGQRALHRLEYGYRELLDVAEGARSFVERAGTLAGARLAGASIGYLALCERSSSA